MGLFESGCKRSSGSYAKDRLKYLLISDKTNCSKDVYEQMQRDIFNVLSKYFEIDSSQYKVSLQKDENDTKDDCLFLYVQVPIRNMNIKTMK